MRSSVVWSFLGVVVLGTGALVSGCDGDATIVRSGEGESCDSSADCAEGYKCFQGACYKRAATDENEGGADGGGGTSAGPPAPVLGSEGESCTKRADCADGLGCFNMRCTAEEGGEGGSGSSGGPTLGQQGETCQTSADCAKPLSCIPGGYTVPGPVGFIGVCSQATGALKPSGKTCAAECLEAADCCELPIEVHIPYAALDTPGVSGPYGTGAQSCSELVSLLGETDCDAAALTPAKAAQCFALSAYCDCAKDTWSCEAGLCVYGAECSVDGAEPGGCPSFSRSGIALLNNCSADTDLCEPDAVAVAGCEKDSDCDGGSTADTLENCAKGECTCYEETGSCYRKCDTTLDCAAGYMCQEDTNVCVPEDECTTNEECAIRFQSNRYVCEENSCKLHCTNDFDCNGGVITDINTAFCDSDQLCKPLGCSSDSQCNKTTAGQMVHMFCTEPEAAAGVATVRSAITD